jgi:hypothetical protein
MTIDERTSEALPKIFIKINEEYIHVEEVIANELKNTSYIKIFIQKIIKIVKSFWNE